MVYLWGKKQPSIASPGKKANKRLCIEKNKGGSHYWWQDQFKVSMHVKFVHNKAARVESATNAVTFIER